MGGLLSARGDTARRLFSWESIDMAACDHRGAVTYVAKAVRFAAVE